MDSEQFLAFSNYTRGLLARLGRGGWRPVFCWGGIPFFYGLFQFAFVEAPRAGYNLPEGYYGAILGLFGLYLTTFITREVGKHLERSAPLAMGPGASAGVATS